MADIKRRAFTKACPLAIEGECCNEIINGECPRNYCFSQDEYFWLLESSNLPESLKHDIPLKPDLAAGDLETFRKIDYIRYNIDEFVEIIDCLYAMHKIELNGEVLHYAG